MLVAYYGKGDDSYELFKPFKIAKDPDFKKEWDDSESEYSLARSFLMARKECNMTQKELAEITGINQADISKIETGNANPAVSTLRRLAEGMGMVLRFEFIPKKVN